MSIRSSGGRGTRPRRGSGSRSREERYRAGKALRHRVPRSRHAAWEPPKDRPDPVDLLAAADRRRLPSLLPIRYGRMVASPFGFLRGSAEVMAWDLARGPTTGLYAQLVGDAHVSNFGLFATPERDRVFDANDFDESVRGPWEWDLKRLATSLFVVARQNRFPVRVARGAALTAATVYRRRLRAYARMRYLDAWYAHLDLASATDQVGRRALRLLENELPAAEQRTGFHAFPKLVKVRAGRARIRDVPPLLRHYRDREAEATVREVFERYRATIAAWRRPLLERYDLADVAQKVVGVGSVGTRCAVGLFLADRDLLEPLFLQVKEALPSVYEPYLGASAFANHAERVVVGQRLVQEASDIFLGWARARGHDFYVRQLRDMKFVADPDQLDPSMLAGEAELCAATLARAHARTGDPVEVSGYLGPGDAFDVAIVRFAERYAAQVQSDHAELVRAVRRGRLPAKPRSNARR